MAKVIQAIQDDVLNGLLAVVAAAAAAAVYHLLQSNDFFGFVYKANR